MSVDCSQIIVYGWKLNEKDYERLEELDCDNTISSNCYGDGPYFFGDISEISSVLGVRDGSFGVDIDSFGQARELCFSEQEAAAVESLLCCPTKSPALYEIDFLDAEVMGHKLIFGYLLTEEEQGRMSTKLENSPAFPSNVYTQYWILGKEVFSWVDDFEQRSGYLPNKIWRGEFDFDVHKEISGYASAYRGTTAKKELTDAFMECYGWFSEEDIAKLKNMAEFNKKIEKCFKTSELRVWPASVKPDLYTFNIDSEIMHTWEQYCEEHCKDRKNELPKLWAVLQAH